MIRLLATVLSDINRYKTTYLLRKQKFNFTKVVLESLMFKPGFQAVLLFRLANFLHRKNFTNIAWLFSRWNQFLTAAELEFNADIDDGLLIPHSSGIVIGRGSKVGKNAIIYNNVTLGTKNLHDIKFPVIGDNVIIFSGAKVLGDIRIGNNVVIGANTVVTQSIPDSSLVIGNKIVPARGKELINKIWESHHEDTFLYS